LIGQRLSHERSDQGFVSCSQFRSDWDFASSGGGESATMKLEEVVDGAEEASFAVGGVEASL